MTIGNPACKRYLKSIWNIKISLILQIQAKMIIYKQKMLIVYM